VSEKSVSQATRGDTGADLEYAFTGSSRQPYSRGVTRAVVTPMGRTFLIEFTVTATDQSTVDAAWTTELGLKDSVIGSFRHS
jgi:hypothetical protein